MSIFPKNMWNEWAQSWGLTHRPQKGWYARNENVFGERKGFLIRVGWIGDHGGTLCAVIRFPVTAEVDRIRQALIDDPALDALPKKGVGRRRMAIETNPKKTVYIGAVPEFALTESSLTWRRDFPFRLPKGEQVQAWVDTLVEALGRTTLRFDGRCETCGAAGVRGYVLVDEFPVVMCSTCQQRLKADSDMAERTYDMIEVSYVNGAVLGAVAAVVGAGAWAGIGALTHRIFALAAIGIGALVAFAYRHGAHRVDQGGRVIAAVLTLGSVVLGEVLLYAIWVAQANPDVGFRVDAGWFVYTKTWAESPREEVITVIFALVGAWFASKALSRPKVAPTVETAEQAAAGQKRAA